MAAVAEHEAKAISDRTRAALAAYKARGGKLGGQLPQCRNLTPETIAKGRERSATARAAAAREAYADLVPMMTQWRAEGLALNGIAERLNAEGHSTRTGKPWNPVQVMRVLQRASVPTRF
jgi:DNA invertase Pin-like site-specific DNA recombinase